MEFSREGDLGNLSYFLSSKRCFFHRFADSGFRNKWTGLWGNEKKLVEYFAIRAGSEWLSSCNIERIEYDYSKAVHHYMTPRGAVKETLFIPEGMGFLAVRITLPESMEVELKLAVNIRLPGENETKRKYEVLEKSRSLEIRNELGCVSFSSRDGYELRGSGEQASHRPSGEPENYFVPGAIMMKGKEITFSIGEGVLENGSFQRILAAKEDARRRACMGLIDSDSEELVKGFRRCASAMGLLRRDGGYYAGLPWFQHFWGRDSLWAVPAITSIGRADEARMILRYFAENSEHKSVPNFVSVTMGKSFNSIDATPLWLIALEQYTRSCGDKRFLREMMPYVICFTEFIYSRTKDGFIAHDEESNETWMDTQRRCCMAVEVQSLCYRALKSASYIFEMLGEQDMGKKATDAMDALEKRFADSFLRNGFYADRIDREGHVSRRTANALVPLFMGPGGKQKGMLDRFESDEFMCRKGIRTLSRKDPAYNPAGYHNGSAWSLTTAWAAAAEFTAGRPSKAWKIMLKMLSDIEEDGIGCIGECWNPETSQLSGCQLQLWGVAFIIRLVDEFMLGIEPDAFRNEITVTPRLPPGIGKVRRTVRLGSRKVTLQFSTMKRGVSVRCNLKGVKLIKK